MSSSAGDPAFQRWRQVQTDSPIKAKTPQRPVYQYRTHPYNQQQQQQQQQQQSHRFGASSSSSSVASTSLPEFAPYIPKTSRQLSLQTYLATLPEWSSATRIVSLYSEFDKLKETNPFGYEANINWWRTVILGSARNGLLSMYQPLSPPMSPSGSPLTALEQFEPTGSSIGILELDLDHLASKFAKNGSRPHSLAAVLTEMSRMGDVVQRSEFLPWAGIGWKGWIFHKVVKAPLLWSLKQLSLSDSSSSPSASYSSSPTLASTGLGQTGSPHSGSSSGMMGSGGMGVGSMSGSNGLGLGTSSPSTSQGRDTYVVLPFVQEAAARILKLQQDSTNFRASDNLLTFAEFREKFSRTALLPIRGKLVGEGAVIVLTDRDLEIIIRYLQHELKVLVTGKLDPSKYDNELQDHELVIKFATKEAIRDRTRQEITQVDRGIIELRETCRRLENQVLDLEERISELTEKARACVKRSQRLQASYALKRRKNLEDVLNKRIKSLETISSILFRIQSSETDAEVLQSYKLGANSLAAVMSTKDQDGAQLLSRDNVESTMDRLADVFADQEEVDEALSAGTEGLLESSVPGGIDEDELMAELDALTESTVSPSPSRQAPVKIRSSSPPVRDQTTEPMPLASSPTEGRSSTGKRVAEIPEQAVFVKQRKVNQATIHSQRGTNGAESVSPTPSCHSETVQEDAMALDQPETLENKQDTKDSIMEPESTHDASESKETSAASGEETHKQEVEGLSTQEERDLQAMLTELEDIGIPESLMTSGPSMATKVQDSSAAGSENPRKENRMMEA
ncbi:charged multivesicular body protein 7 [Entomortierella parvispora]|uniref:Charged multivesicular body protein 7 n=1 Tax=Entomortierella parvispora TaxID=205924 RepID=A0A9P3HLX1_9FUNG|nr:charged multivesicular body protein 7 [Entomortierella parvispora]